MGKEALYTRASLGCHGDGAFGHAHIRARLAEMMERLARKAAHPGDSNTAAELAEVLRQEMSDDASEENDAIDLLNEYTAPDVAFEFVDGDLVLTETEEA